MENASSLEEKVIRCQFDCFSKMVLHGEMVNYYKHMEYRRKNEVSFAELTSKELSSLCTYDVYAAEQIKFSVMNFEVLVNDILIAKALQKLPKKKRDIVLLSFFMEMSDAEIADYMNLVRSTIYHHRKNSLKSLRKIMEDLSYEN